MRTVGAHRAMPFEATLTNAVPPGEIGTSGTFGPWKRDNPGGTPLGGTFTFNRADLSVFKGISGILAAHGGFGGSLGRIRIHGETNTPDFTVTVSGQPVALHADYQAMVDGTNGNTYLDRIDAQFLDTALVANGAVTKTPGRHGRTVSLDIAMDRARLQDVLRLAVKSARPPMTGALVMNTRFVLPPGDQDVVDKLQLDGQFSIATAKFADLDVQKKVDELSNRSRGKTDEDGAQRGVVSKFTGRFKLGNGTLSLPGFSFDTPGAEVRLRGAYHLKSERLDFKGMLLMAAKVSETQKGIKRWVLKIVDPLFSRKDGGSAIPIKIEGQRSDPKFGLDKGRIFHRGQ
jgi:hypothetical protein